MMQKNIIKHPYNGSYSKVLLIIPIILLTDCGYTLKYDLTADEIIISDTTKPFNVLVTKFSDIRPKEERLETTRTALNYDDIGDYTYDEEFKGEVNEEISKMIAEHLAYSKAFLVPSDNESLEFACVSESEITYDFLDSLKYSGVDAILIGEINHFYGFYYTDVIDFIVPFTLGCAIGIPLAIASVKTEYFIGVPYIKTDLGMEIMADLAAYAAGTVGELMVNTRERDFEWHTNLSARLINTSNYEIVWEDEVESYSKGHRAFTGFGKNKFELAVESLRDAVNQMVENLSKTAFYIELAGN